MYAVLLVLIAAVTPGWSSPVTREELTGTLENGALFVTVAVPHARYRFRNEGSDQFVSLDGGARLTREDGGGGWLVAAADGTRWHIGRDAPVVSEMRAPQAGGERRRAPLVAAALTHGETRRWLYETREDAHECGPVGRFGLLDPNCRTRTLRRPLAVVSSRGVALAPVYARPIGEGDTPALSIAILDIGACGSADALTAATWPACRARARTLRTIGVPR